MFEQGGIYTFARSFDGPTKVGITESLEKRFKGLTKQAEPGYFIHSLFWWEEEVLGPYNQKEVRSWERAIHEGIAHKRHKGTEWFDAKPGALASALERYLPPQFECLTDPLCLWQDSFDYDDAKILEETNELNQFLIPRTV